MVAFAVFGAVCMLLGIGMLLRTKKLRQICTVQTEAAIIGVERVESENTETDSDGYERTTTSITYAPVYRYYADGRYIVKRSSVSSSKQVSVGNLVTLFYNPDNVEQFYVLEDKAANHIGWFLGIFGLAFMVIGIVISA